MRRSTMMRLAMGSPWPHQKCGDDREREIDRGQRPQTAPIVKYLPQRGAQLIDANDAVDGEVRWEDVTQGLHRFWYRLARPRETGQEELRQAGAEEDQGR